MTGPEGDAARRLPRAQQGQRVRAHAVRAGPGPGAALGRRSAGWPPRPRCTRPGPDDFLRTRLTHSLEVAQIAREMGARLGCDPDVVDTAGLAHDLGHPPFGHNGEDALDAVAAAVRRLRGQRADAAGAHPAGGQGAARRRSAGLNLTRAVARRHLQVPVAAPAGRAASSGCTPTTCRSSTGLRDGARPGERRCLEAQVMDWADDVAYSVHDVEDGVHGGYVSLGRCCGDADERAALCADVAAAYSDERGRRCGEALAELLADPVLAAGGRLRRQPPAPRSRSSAMTSVLTGRFVAAAVGATRAAGTAPGRCAATTPIWSCRARSGRSARCSRASRCGT